MYYVDLMISQHINKEIWWYLFCSVHEKTRSRTTHGCLTGDNAPAHNALSIGNFWPRATSLISYNSSPVILMKGLAGDKGRVVVFLLLPH